MFSSRVFIVCFPAFDGSTSSSSNVLLFTLSIFFFSRPARLFCFLLLLLLLFCSRLHLGALHWWAFHKLGDVSCRWCSERKRGNNKNRSALVEELRWEPCPFNVNTCVLMWLLFLIPVFCTQSLFFCFSPPPHSSVPQWRTYWYSCFLHSLHSTPGKTSFVWFVWEYPLFSRYIFLKSGQLCLFLYFRTNRYIHSRWQTS